MDTGADDWAVVRDEDEGTRNPGRPGVVEKLPREPKEISGCVPLDRSGCVTRATDMKSDGNRQKLQIRMCRLAYYQIQCSAPLTENLDVNRKPSCY